MGHDSARAELQVIVAKDALTAELSIPHNVCAEQFTVEVLVAALKSAQVEITEEVVAKLEQLVAEPPGSGKSHRVRVAEAVAPVHGIDGHIEWKIDEDRKPPVREDGSISFYDQSAYTMVQSGQIIGRVVPPTEGREGRDVLGNPIPAKRGQIADPKLDDTIVLNLDAELVAQVDGVFMRKGARPTICQVLEVPGYVDFSTGNIDFHGEVIIRKGIRDLFRVRSTGRIEVHTLVEAATLDCDGDIVLVGGMAGREQGCIKAGGNVVARHLNATRLDIKGDLHFEKEMIGCAAMVHGRVIAPQGSIIGGTLSGMKELEVGVLGSTAGVETIIQLNSLPLLRARVRKLDDLMAQSSRIIQALLQQREQLLATAKQLPPRVRDRLITVTEEIRATNDQMKEAQRERDELSTVIQTLLMFKASIATCLHVGTVFQVGRQPLRVFMDVLGPLRISVAESGQILVHPEDAAAMPLEKIARPHSTSSAA